jgi:hypothetical protein
LPSIKNKPKASHLLLSIIFEDARAALGASPTDKVEIKLSKTIGSLSLSERRRLLSGLRAICRDQKIDIRVRSKADLTRLLLGAAYWGYLLIEFPMEMSSDDAARKRRWIEVETISGVPKADIFKLTNYLSSDES